MIDKPQVVQSPAQLTAVIRMKVARADMPKVMGPAFGELMSAVAAQGAGPAGPVGDHHFRIEPQTFDFEVCVPVTKAVTPVGRVVPSSRPAMKVARTVYHGPYEGLGPAWGEFDAWIAAQGLRPSPELWQTYAAGPESGPDASKWRTVLERPLVG
jgi:effector-binding domain-containing protein